MSDINLCDTEAEGSHVPQQPGLLVKTSSHHNKRQTKYILACLLFIYFISAQETSKYNDTIITHN